MTPFFGFKIETPNNVTQGVKPEQIGRVGELFLTSTQINRMKKTGG